MFALDYFKRLEVTPLSTREQVQAAFDKVQREVAGGSVAYMNAKTAYQKLMEPFKNGETLLSLIDCTSDLKEMLKYCSLDDCLVILHKMAETRAPLSSFSEQYAEFISSMRERTENAVLRTAAAYGVAGSVGAIFSALTTVSMAMGTVGKTITDNLLSSRAAEECYATQLERVVPNLVQMTEILSGLSDDKAQVAVMFLRGMSKYDSMCVEHTANLAEGQSQTLKRSFFDTKAA